MTSRNCIECTKVNIKKRASFNLPTEIKAKYCKDHKTDDMVNVNQNKCQEDDCGKQPAFNYDGEKVGKYCSGHSKEGMVNVAYRNGKCKGEGCMKTYPIFNYKGEKKGIYCKEHALEGMVDIKNPSCEIEGCEHQPRFNLPSIKKGRFCEEHKHEGMMNVMSNQCEYPECTTRPSYNYLGKKKGRFCIEHCLEGMVDVVSRKCLIDGCDKQPKYSWSDSTIAEYCVNHAKVGMENIRNIRCKTENCPIQPYYNNRHKYKGYCLTCFIQKFPDEPVARNYKTKEKATTDYLISKFPNMTLMVDKKIYDGCSTKRPDVFIDFGSHIVIVEIDENAHRSYDTTCDNKRIMVLSQDVHFRPIIFIRFNPDGYYVKKKFISSCWVPNLLGILVVPKEKQDEWQHRLDILTNKIIMCSKQSITKTVEQVFLFYDET